jgi:hypothetical protein
VDEFLTVTLALARTWPDESVIVPESVACASCAWSELAVSTQISTTSKKSLAVFRFIGGLPPGNIETARDCYVQKDAAVKIRDVSTATRHTFVTVKMHPFGFARGKLCSRLSDVSTASPG